MHGLDASALHDWDRYRPRTMGRGRRGRVIVRDQRYYDRVCGRADLFPARFFAACRPTRLAIAALIDGLCHAELVLLIPLTAYSIRFFEDATRNREINDVVTSEIAQLNGSELVELPSHKQGTNWT